MQAIESKTMHILVENLSAISRDLPFESGQAWAFSSHYMARYLQEHADNGTGLSSSEAAMMAAARLDWILQETRPTLSGLFSERDITVLMDCYQGGMFSPDQMNSIASDLCDHVGIELGEPKSGSIGQLIGKLRSLSSVQRVTLADALEQTWNRGMGVEQKQPREFLASMGILLD
jgi:hypothetical protein